MRKRSRRQYYTIPLAAVLTATLLWSCSGGPPKNIHDSCEIFDDKGGWYRDAKRAFERWGVPIHVQLAIIYQESKFVDDAKPPRDYLLWVIPWGRVSSAYGYAQAKDTTWDWYREKSGNRSADRDDFADAVDFIAWYGHMSHRMLGISRSDSYRQYLAYHEGQGGYRRKTYAAKPWLIKVARKVDDRARRYQAQLAQCEDELDSGWRLWPF
jgi:hypothetical protein